MPHWRKATWTFIIFNIVMMLILLWVISTLQSVNSACDGRVIFAQDCNNAAQAGSWATLFAFVLIVFWLPGALGLAITWVLTRPNTRPCPRCGLGVQRGLTECPTCGYLFGKAIQPKQRPPIFHELQDE
jgi:hypothetical protein